ncbi:MAG: membrane protein insertase YidC [Erysipelotrichaceae bacterium]|nr:membrane protein insertase YidC [Erysipelotrichaceae bacterium]
MKFKNKKLLMLLVIISALFLVSGCSSPTDENGKVIMITSSTTFKQIFDTESWFSALFVFPLSYSINLLTPKVGVAGAIATVTVLVNGVILLLTMKSNVQTQQMQLLQPEMDRINKKYEGKTDDASNMRKAQEIQSLYAKYNINPLGTILVTFVQFPIIFAMFQAVQRAESVAKGSFIGLSLEQSPWNGIKSGQYLYIAIFIVMMITQVSSMMLPQFIAKNKAKKEAEKRHKKPEQSNNPNQNMMYYMMIPILVLSITWPAAMSIYWIINSLVNIGKTLIVQKVISNTDMGVK